MTQDLRRCLFNTRGYFFAEYFIYITSIHGQLLIYFASSLSLAVDVNWVEAAAIMDQAKLARMQASVRIGELLIYFSDTVL